MLRPVPSVTASSTFCKQFLYLNLWTFTQCHVCKSRGTTNCLSSPWHFTFCGTYLWISSLSSSGPSVQLNSYSTNSTTWWLINWFKSIMFSYAFNLWSCDVSKQRDMYQPTWPVSDNVCSWSGWVNCLALLVPMKLIPHATQLQVNHRIVIGFRLPSSVIGVT